MKHSYPSTQIIKYIYNELEALEHLETEYAIEHDPRWASSYKKLKSAYSALPKVEYYPKKHVLKSILSYSAAM